MDWQKKLSGKKETKPKLSIPKSSPKKHDDKAPEKHELKDFTEIGGSPVPGLTLRYALRGHTGSITRIAWSLNGKYLASPSDDKTIRIWDVNTGECVIILEGHTGTIYTVAWSPDGLSIASACASEGKVFVWDVRTGKKKVEIEQRSVAIIDWSPDGKMLATAAFSEHEHDVIIWDTKSWEVIRKFDKHDHAIFSLAWSPDGSLLASGSYDEKIVIYENSLSTHKILEGDSGAAMDIAWVNNSEILIGSNNYTIQKWNIQSSRKLLSLEGHTGRVKSIALMNNGMFCASKSEDGTIKIWRTDDWTNIAEIIESKTNQGATGMEFHPYLPILASLGEKETIIRIWDLDEVVLLGQAKENINYTTAKLVLVGDSGVGKTGLGWRLSHNEFKEHASTHGQQFWSIPELGLKRKDGTDCEAVLWDLAGQHVYRQVHSIFLENVAAALVIFDPSNRQDPLKGAQFWLEQLKDKGKLPPTVLVGARIDRGAPTLSHQDLDLFCQRNGITGGYLSTSAMSGEGLDLLLEKLKAQIPWEDMTATVTTVTFKRIKDYVLSLKEKTDRKGVLVSPNELRALLETSEVWKFTDAEMMTALGHLETHGYVSILHNSAGETYILLAPELLVNIAASIMLLADKNARELGAVSETELLHGKIPFLELTGLDKSEGQILLDAAILRFLEHSICFRETLGNDTLLIFPSLIKQKRPLQDNLPSIDDISYVVHGHVENLYASLVVLLGYTPSFMRINQWQNQAQYEMGVGEICGFRMIEEREGEIELVLYYDDKMPAAGRDKYQELFEHFLYQRNVEVTRFPPVVCPNGHRIERSTVIKRARESKDFVFCDECGEKILLPDFEKPQTIGISTSVWLQMEEATARLRSSYEVYLTLVKSYRRAWAIPRCYISYIPEQLDLAKKLIHNLQEAGVFVIDRVDDLKSEDFVIVLNSCSYEKAYKTSSTLLANDLNVILTRLASGNKKVLSLACEGQMELHDIKHCIPGDFCDETHYSVSLFDLILNLYAIPLNHAGFAPLCKKLHEQWEYTLAGKNKKMNDMTALKIFISYSHKDEEFKDDLVTMLEGLRRQGVISPWQDRCIEEGDEWYQEIQDAMNECDLAILLVSKHFIASRFIQDEELPLLLQRRSDLGLRVVPIIVRPCKWSSEPVLSKLQALPKDGKAVITFSKENGDSDQVWTDIATAIEKRAKANSIS